MSSGCLGPSYVNGEPHAPQKPRFTPGDDSKYAGMSLENRNLFFDTVTHVVNAEDTARRQLSQ
jgi:hypothetical protein